MFVVNKECGVKIVTHNNILCLYLLEYYVMVSSNKIGFVDFYLCLV